MISVILYLMAAIAIFSLGFLVGAAWCAHFGRGR